MVSLKKPSQTREITPVHLMNEEEAVRIYCPQKAENTNTVDILVKQPDKKELPAIKDNHENKTPKKRTYGGFEKWEWFEMIPELLFIVAVLATLIFMSVSFFGELFSLLKI
ncbi:MAG: hypothetical protein HDT43_00200 [Ruminococcaceae bacterium]|nr:hypothetical protein [Oscillospiraceae bacterium]